MTATKRELRKEFFDRIPKARKMSPVFQALFEFMYQAHLLAKPGAKLLNIYASQDFSSGREEVYREKFFNDCEYEAIDFWKDRFIYNDKPTSGQHVLPFPDNSFDVLVTTKYILEHVSEPEHVLREFHRVLKPGGEAFVTATLVRRQHQAPHDYFRFTEYALEYLFKKVGFSKIDITPTNGSMVTLTSYSYFFQRGINMPRIAELFFNQVYYWIIEPAGFLLDKLDNGYGRDFSLYFLVRAKK